MSIYTICTESSSFQTSKQKLLILQFAENCLIPQFAAKTSYSTIHFKNFSSKIGSKSFSCHNWRTLVIPQIAMLIKHFTAKTSHSTNCYKKILIPQFAAKTSHSTIRNKTLSFQTWQRKLLIPEVAAIHKKNFSFHILQQKFLIPQFTAETSICTICSKSSSFHNSLQKLLILQFAEKFLIPQSASKTSYSTICSDNFSIHNFQQKVIISK